MGHEELFEIAVSVFEDRRSLLLDLFLLLQRGQTGVSVAGVGKCQLKKNENVVRGKCVYQWIKHFMKSARMAQLWKLQLTRDVTFE